MTEQNIEPDGQATTLTAEERQIRLHDIADLIAPPPNRAARRAAERDRARAVRRRRRAVTRELSL